jgi:hypothetical protein
MRLLIRRLDWKSLLVGVVVGLVVGVFVSVPLGANLGLWTTTTTYESGLPPECIGKATCEQLILESYDWRDLGYLKAKFRNVGAAGIGITNVQLEGVTQSWSGDCPEDPYTTDSGGNLIENRSLLLQPGLSCSISIAVACELCNTLAVTPGQPYALRIQAYFGTVFTYSVIAGGTYGA